MKVVSSSDVVITTAQIPGQKAPLIITEDMVAQMSPGPVSNSLQWDGKSGGSAVSGGVYIYQLKGEGTSFNGTLVVIK